MLGVLVLNKSITMTVLAGIALVLAGVALTRRRADQPWIRRLKFGRIFT